ncbi:MAG: endolytic transglycosylase MltG [Proteobacteria bacterium]|nr:endolytic transglycosylase MltG [Pseudomonadota bacterium]
MRPRIMATTTSLLLLSAVACSDDQGNPRDPVDITVPAGSTLSEVADTLSARGVIGSKRPFELYARFKGADRDIKSGRYVLATGSSWGDALDHLTRGTVVTIPMTIPEGFRVQQMVPRIAELTGRSEADVSTSLAAQDIETQLQVPGPGPEGYLFPDTYRFAQGVPVDAVLSDLAGRYTSIWTPERRARLDSLGMSERELVTLASIIQAEARKTDEMPHISSVFHNRLEQGWLLQADPTVLYALGGPRARLLYAAIDSVQDNPYNTYTQRGLPPGPIGAPGEAAIEAALYPVTEEYMYFVARPDGSHVFTKTLADHNRAKAAARRAWDAIGSGDEVP